MRDDKGLAGGQFEEEQIEFDEKSQAQREKGKGKRLTGRDTSRISILQD
jgi:hypothetical protein